MVEHVRFSRQAIALDPARAAPAARRGADRQPLSKHSVLSSASDMTPDYRSGFP
jgi:hypothetical protein